MKTLRALRAMLALTVLVLMPTVAIAADVTIGKAADGFLVTTENYQAAIGSDGNFHSLRAGGTEFLLDNRNGLVGGGYLNFDLTNNAGWEVEAFRFAEVAQTAPDTLVATAPKHKLTLKFLPDAIEMAFNHPGPPSIWYFTLNPALTDVIETESGESIPPKVLNRDGAPQFFDAAGASVTLPRGALYWVDRNGPPLGNAAKSDSDPLVHQIWMPQTGATDVYTKRLVIHAKPTVADALQASLAVARPNHIFPSGAPAEVGLAAKARFPGLAVDGQVDLAVKDFFTGKEVFRQSQEIKVPALTEKRSTFSVKLPPGVYDARLAIKQGAETLATRTFPMASSIEGMKLPDRPADFDKFWDDTLAEQEKIPANLQLTLHKEAPDYKLYKIRFDGLLGRQFHGWLSIPVKPGKYLADITLPPSGINPPYLPYSGPNIVGMSLAIAGQETEPPPGGYKQWDYFRSGIETRETWYYRAVFAACSRAVDILAARPEVDAKRIFVHGGSQGGGLTFITAALNPKVAAAVSSSPGLFALEWRLRYGNEHWWPWIFPIDENRKPITDAAAVEARIAVARYGDAANFASRIRCPILLQVGLQDQTTAAAGVLAAWSRLSNAPIKALLADPWGGHNGPRGGQALQGQWLTAVMAGNTAALTGLKESGGLPVIVETKP